LKPFNRFERQFVQALAAMGHIGDDLIAHAALPEFLEMIQNTRDGFVVRIAGKEQGDLVRPVNHRIGRFHALVAGGAG